jgi:hypothetical protein
VDSLCQFKIVLHRALFRSSHHHPPTTVIPPHLKQLQKVPSFYFMYVYEAHQPYSLTFIPSIRPLPPPPVPPILYLFYSPFILNSKSMFKVISRHISAVSILNFDQFNPPSVSLDGNNTFLGNILL